MLGETIEDNACHASPEVHLFSEALLPVIVELDLPIESKAEALARAIHSDQWRQNGLPYIVHPENVARHTREMILPDFGPVTEAAAWAHDTTETSPLVSLRRPMRGGKSVLPLEDIFPPDFCYIMGLLQNDERTYKAYIERFHRNVPGKDRELAALAILVKFADRIDNTLLGETLDVERALDDYRQLTDSSQEDLLLYYKRKDLLHITEDADGQPIRWYDENGRLRYDEDLFVAASESAFACKVATNARDNLAIFLPELEEKILACYPGGGGIFRFEVVWRKAWELYVTSLDILEVSRQGGIRDILLFANKREAQRALHAAGESRRLSIFEQITELYLAGLEGGCDSEGASVDSEEWRTPHAPISVADMRLKFQESEGYSHNQTALRVIGFHDHMVAQAKPVGPLELEEWDGIDRLSEWAERVAVSIHKDAVRESGETELEHAAGIVDVVAELIIPSHCEEAMAATWLHNAIKHHGSRLEVFAPRNRKEGVVYFEDLLGVSFKDEHGGLRKGPASRACDILDLVSWRVNGAVSYKQHTDRISQQSKGVSRDVRIIAGLIKAIDCYQKVLTLNQSIKVGDSRADWLAALAIGNIDFFLPSYIEEYALLHRRNKITRGLGIFDFDKLWDFAWRSYVLSLDTLQALGRGGIENVGVFMRGWSHRDRSIVTGKELGIKTPLSMIRMLDLCAKNGLCHPDSGLPVRQEEYREVHRPVSVEMAELYYRPWARVLN